MAELIFHQIDSAIQYQHYLIFKIKKSINTHQPMRH